MHHSKPLMVVSWFWRTRTWWFVSHTQSRLPDAGSHDGIVRILFMTDIPFVSSMNCTSAMENRVVRIRLARATDDVQVPRNFHTQPEYLGGFTFFSAFAWLPHQSLSLGRGKFSSWNFPCKHISMAKFGPNRSNAPSLRKFALSVGIKVLGSGEKQKSKLLH